MELYIAGGVGEHGRSCFYVQGETCRFLVDCGKMADTPEVPYPRLTSEQIRRLDAVFLTHSHADHTGALPWLYENGFQGIVIAAEETLRKSCALEALCPAGAGRLHYLVIRWGAAAIARAAYGTALPSAEKTSSFPAIIRKIRRYISAIPSAISGSILRCWTAPTGWMKRPITPRAVISFG